MESPVTLTLHRGSLLLWGRPQLVASLGPAALPGPLRVPVSQEEAGFCRPQRAPLLAVPENEDVGRFLAGDPETVLLPRMKES